MSDLRPTELAVTADLTSARFRIGVKRGHWRKVSYVFPILVIAVAAVEPNGNSTEYFFRFELTGFPGTAPDVRIWDYATDALLALGKSDGHWCFELEADCTIPAEYVLMRHYRATVGRREAAEFWGFAPSARRFAPGKGGIRN